jgi:hypothetical protein
LCLILFASGIFNTGCTALSLRRNTIDQAETYMDMNYKQVMENLAMIYCEPESLPSCSVISYGTMDVLDSLTGTTGVTMSTVPVVGALDFPAQRTIKGNWAATPVVTPEALRALQMAFRHVLFRDPVFSCAIGHNQYVSLAKYKACAPQGFYFGVADDLADIDATCGQWLGKGTKKEAPKDARYEAHCGDKWVWVCPNGMAGLSKFTLVVQTIVKQLNLPAIFYPRPCQFTFTDQKLWYLRRSESDGVCQAPKIDATGDVTITEWGKENFLQPKSHLTSSTAGDQKLKSSINGRGS